MKYLICCIVLGTIGCPVFAPSQTTDSIPVITSDIDLFWQCFDEAKPGFEARHFKKYIEKGSQGVKDFIPYRIESAKKLAKKVKANRKKYEAIRELSLNIESTHRIEMEQIYQNLKALYPDAVFAPAYFVIGRFNSGGTSSANGIIMGAETFDEESFSHVPGVVAHELIHFQQELPPSKTLFDQCIREGSADLLGLIIHNKPLKHHLDDWALPREEEIWAKFQEDMHKTEYGGWLYGGKPLSGSPKDLGYWMGYQICKAYYDKQEDKKQAIYDILHIKDYHQFLQKSGYGQ